MVSRVPQLEAASKPAGLTSEELLEAYSQMLLARTLGDRVWTLNRQGKVPIVAAPHGHEAAQLGAIWALDPSRDLFFLYYRDVAAAIALGVTAKELMLGFYGKVENPFSGGRQFPLHGAYLAKRIINPSNVVTSNVPHAVGAALAAKMRREPTVVLSCFGDGATSEGEWHEALNFAGIHRLAVVFLCENNRLAISVTLRKQMAVKSVAERAAGYGFPGVSVDGCDLEATHRAVRQAAQRAREGGGPTLIEARVERLLPHTTDDDDRRYRTPEELEQARQRDPTVLLRRRLTELGVLAPEMDEAYRQRAQQEVDEATEYAEAAPFPDPSTMFDHLYGDRGG